MVFLGREFRLEEDLLGKGNTSTRLELLEGLLNAVTMVEMEMKTRFPKLGTNRSEFAYAHILHPRLKGYLLTKCSEDKNLLDNMVAELISSHPSTIAAVNRQPQPNLVTSQTLSSNDSDEPMNVEPTVVHENDDLDALLAEREQKRQVEIPDEPPLQLEMDFYLKAAPAPKDVDVLKWWNANQSQYKILSTIAR